MAIMLCACFIIKFASWVLQNVYVRYHTMLHEFENIYIYICKVSHYEQGKNYIQQGSN